MPCDVVVVPLRQKANGTQHFITLKQYLSVQFCHSMSAILQPKFPFYVFN